MAERHTVAVDVVGSKPIRLPCGAGELSNVIPSAARKLNLCVLAQGFFVCGDRSKGAKILKRKTKNQVVDVRSA